MKTTPGNELKLNYRKFLELGLIISLLLHVIIFQISKRMSVKQEIPNFQPTILVLEDIPQIQLEKQLQAPVPPTVPIPSEDEDLPEEETIEIFDNTVVDIPLPSSLPIANEEPVFVAFDKAPEPVGGFRSIQSKLIYPEIARKAGVEGRVVIWAHVDEQGNVLGTKIQKSLGPNGCDEAAISAINSVKWKPALQRDRPVEVWIAVPVDFKLR